MPLSSSRLRMAELQVGMKRTVSPRVESLVSDAVELESEKNGSTTGECLGWHAAASLLDERL